MKVGMVCYATEQGLGYLAKSFYDAGVVDEVLIFAYPNNRKKNHTEWYPEGTPMVSVRPFVGREASAFISCVDVVLFFESPFDWKFPERCRIAGVKTVMIPMYEWWPTHPTHKFDAMISPSLLDKDYFPESTFVPIPVDGQYWKQRYYAKRFIHNGGGIGSREHKGTRQFLEATKLVKSNAEMVVRAQDRRALASIYQDVFKTDKRPDNLTVESGSVPYEQLWDGDVLVAPEKYNGLSLPLQEAYAAGMLVMTTNRYPVNTWLPTRPLIPVYETHKVQVHNGYLEIDESTVRPEDIAAGIDGWYGGNIVEESLKGRIWAEENSWDVLKPVYLKELERVCLL